MAAIKRLSGDVVGAVSTAAATACKGADPEIATLAVLQGLAVTLGVAAARAALDDEEAAGVMEIFQMAREEGGWA